MPTNTTPTFLTTPGGGYNIVSNPGALDFGGKSFVLPDGKIVIVGNMTNGIDLGSGALGRDVLIRRFNADGTIDTSFGTGGYATTHVSQSVDIRAATIDASGNILVAGGSLKAAPSSFEFLVLRYTPNGTLDPTFSSDGIATNALHVRSDVIYSITTLATGKILVAGYAQSGTSSTTRDFEIARYNADGTLDPTFNGDGNSDGWVTTTVSATQADRATSMAVLDTGKILVLGVANSASNVADAALVRYNDDGSLDTSFGVGGKLVLPTSNGSASNNGADTWQSMQVEADGKIVIAGVVASGLGNGSTVITLMRLNADGSADTTFNGDGNADGKIQTPLGDIIDIAYKILEQPDGKYLVSGLSFYNSGLNYGVLLRYNHDGSLDTGFGAGGVVYSPFSMPADAAYQDVTLQADGKIVVAGWRGLGADDDLGVFRYNSNGTLDTSFGVSSNASVLTYTSGGTGVPLAPTLKVYDAEFAALNGGLGDYGGATLTVVRHGGVDNPDDDFEVSGALTTTNVSGMSGTLLLHGTLFGTFTEDSAGLKITVAAGTTQARLDEAVHLITYSNTSSAPPFSVQVDLVFSDGNTSATASSFIAITDMPQIRFEAALVDEAVGVQLMKVGLDHASAGIVTVNWSTADGSAVAGQDYVATSGTLTFLPGETEKTIPVTILNDSQAEAGEYFKITYSNVTGAIIHDGTEKPIFIAQNDSPVQATPSIGAAQAAAHENEGDLFFVVSLDAPSAQTVTVNYVTVPDTAGTADFVPVSGTLTFLPGETMKTVEMDVLNDSLAESTESFTLSLSGATNATIGTPSVTARILDDDSASFGVTLNGSDGPDLLLGTFYNDTLIAGAGNDLLIGDEGNDSALGGLGDDLYLVDHAGFIVVEAASEGNDTVLLNDLASYTLPANVENLRMFSGAVGDTLVVGGAQQAGFRVSDSNNPIVGTWVPTDGGEADDGTGLVALTFLADGSYMMAQDGSSIADPTGQDGMERGTYTWNESSGAFAKTTTVDTNGEWGLSHTTITSVEVRGDTLILNTNEGAFTGTRVTSATNPLVGSWFKSESGQLSVVTLLADGQYMIADDINPVAGSADGMERGTYTWDPVTGAFTHVTTVDTNGNEGFSAGGPSSMSIVGVTGIGNELDNLLVGNNSANSLSGAGGNDTLQGNGGNDTLDGGDGTDTAVFSANFAAYTIATQVGNNDLVVSGPDGIDTLRNIEILQFADNTFTIKDGTAAAEVLTGNDTSDLIRGRDGNDTVAGGAGNDALYGDEGTDTLDGGTGNDFMDGGTGADSMAGGTGDDTYIVDSLLDVVNETLPLGFLKDPLADNPGGGVDTVVSSVNYTLGNFLENLTLAGNAGALSGLGNALANILTGNASNNSLGGAAGNDTIDGSDGVDTATFSGNRSAYALGPLGQATTSVNSAAEGNDTLSHVERLLFADARVAIDTTGAAGHATQLTGAIFGGASIANGALVGQQLAQFDAGLTTEEVAAAALASPGFAAAAGSHSNTAFVNFVYQNVAGVLPDVGTLNLLVGALNSGLYTQASMSLLAADYVGLGAVATSGLAYTLQEASVRTGGAGNDTLTGDANANTIFGRDGNDVMTGAAGNDLIVGGAGLDRAVYSTTKAASTVTHNDLGLVVTTGGEVDQLEQVERITYSNISVAYDTSGNAGTVAKMIGAMFGIAALQDEALVGQYLAMLDAGTSYEGIVGAAAASTRFGTEAGSHSNAAFVDRVYFNIAGFHPDAATAAPLIAILDNATYTQAQLGVLAAEVDYNVGNVNLTGLAATGLEYTLTV